MDQVLRQMNEMEERYWRVIGHCVRERRRALHWSQADLAARTGLSRGEIQHIESHRRNPRVGTLKRLCKAFGISYMEFVAQTERVEQEWLRAAR
ncbi:MAG: helix-turn-helix domain-containing protein [Verrucomicrobiaceae bacterium]